MEVHIKIWLEQDGQLAFGEGLRQLLSSVERLGSLSAAATSMGLAYREAWGRIKAAEAHIGQPFLVRHKGGRGGGGAELTGFAQELMARFGQIEATLHAAAAELSAGLPDVNQPAAGGQPG